MRKFQITPKIYEYDTFREVSTDFQISEGDLVLTHKFLYESFMKRLELSCIFLFQEDYGIGEPSDEMVDKILKDTYGKGFKRVFGIGGGTIMDIAKILVVKNAMCTLDIYEDKIPLLKDKELVLIPTTCGSGSEMTCVCVIDLKSQKAKIGKRMECSFADAAVLVPELLKDLPYEIFLYSSVDALIHAMEIFVSSKSSDYDEIFCAEAIRLILRGYAEIINSGPNGCYSLTDRFLKASNYSGVALANVIAGNVHAMAMHFGSAHHVSHGESCYCFLTEIFNRYAQIAPQGKISMIAKLINNVLEIEGDTPSAFNALEELLVKLIPRKKLRDYGMAECYIENYADKVLATQQRLLRNSYVLFSREQIIDVYRRLY
jgi:4-hydroxybutyrate dehydrogenase